MNPLDYKDVAQCKKCSALGEDHCPSAGSPTADVLILGHTPGVSEIKVKEPVVNDAGALLNLMLHDAELSRQNIYITYALKCHPPGGRPPAKYELTNCMSTWLKHELKQVKPKIIITLGKDAFTALKCNESDWGHGNVFKYGPFTVLCLYHPSYYLRRKDLDGFIQVGAKRLRELLGKDEQVSD